MQFGGAKVAVALFQWKNLAKIAKPTGSKI
jgi:hypothetical protein